MVYLPMDVNEAIKTRRSIREFDERTIPKETIKQLIECARWAPNACNKQLWKFVVITNPNIKNEISKKVGYHYSYIEAPCLIGVFYHKEQWNSQFYDGLQSAAAAIQNILLSAHSIGLGGLWWCSIPHPEALKNVLHVPDDYRMIAMVSIGYPKENPTPPFRKDVKDILYWEQFPENIPKLSSNPDDFTLKEIADYRCCISSHSGTGSLLEIYEPHSRVFRIIVDFASEYVAEKDKPTVLDIHSYGGEFLDGLIRRAPHANFIAYESNDSLVNLTNSRLSKKIEYITSESHTIPLPDNSVDIVSCFHRVERVPDYKLLLTEIERVLKPGGYFIVSFFNKNSLIWKLRNLYKYKSVFRLKLPYKRLLTEESFWMVGPQGRISYKELDKTLKNFKVIKQLGIAPPYYYLCLLLHSLFNINLSVIIKAIKTKKLRELISLPSCGRDVISCYYWYKAREKIISNHIFASNIGVKIYEKY